MTLSGDGEEPVAGPDALGAETYLRLMAEAQLRVARETERWEQPLDRLPPAALSWAGNAAGTVAGTAALARQRVRPAAARLSQAAEPVLAQPRVAAAVQRLTPPAQAAGQAVGPYARRAGRIAARGRRRARGAAGQLVGRLLHDERHRPLTHDPLQRVGNTAEVLVATGALSERVAQAVVAEFETALLARGFGSLRLWHRREVLQQARHQAPAGPYAVFPVGRTVSLEKDGHRADMYVLVLALTPDVPGISTVTFLRTEPGPGPDDMDGLHGLVFGLQGQATDSQGGSYRLQAGGGGGSSDGPWVGTLQVVPPPSAGIAWLELTVAGGQAPIRVEMTAAGPAPDTELPRLSPAQRAERVIDAASAGLLAADEPGPEGLAAVADLVGALRAAGTLEPDSPALRRLAAVTRRTGPAPADDDQEKGATADWPERWSALTEGCDWTGRDGVGTAAAVLPALDGTRCLVSGLVSAADETELQVLAWGWDAGPGPWRDSWRRFQWWVRDDTGRWYRGDQGGGGYSDGQARFSLQLNRPLHPEATRLEIILSGVSGDVSASTAVGWVSAGSTP
jgi:hypothetical protein